MNEKPKRKYVLKNPQPKKVHQVNTILDDAQYQILKEYRDFNYPGKKMSLVLRELVLDIKKKQETLKTFKPRYLGDAGN